MSQKTKQFIESVGGFLTGIGSYFGLDKAIDNLLFGGLIDTEKEYNDRVTKILQEFSKNINSAKVKAEAQKKGLRLPSTQDILRIQQRLNDYAGFRVPSSLKTKLQKAVQDDQAKLLQAERRYEEDSKAYNDALQNIEDEYQKNLSTAQTVKDMQMMDVDAWKNYNYNYERGANFEQAWKDSDAVKQLKGDLKNDIKV